MELHCKLISRLPEETIRLLGIDENTAFETYFEDGAIVVCPHPEWKEDTDEEVCDGNCEGCAFENCCPYEAPPEETPATDEIIIEEEPEDDDADEDDEDDDCSPGSEECKTCEYYCQHCGRCVLEEQEGWNG